MKRFRSRGEVNYINSLIDAIKFQDSNSFAAFYAATAEEQYRKIYRKVQDAYLSQDLLQELYIHFFQQIALVERAKDAYLQLDTIREGLIQEKIARGLPKGPSHREYGKLSMDIEELLLQSILAHLDLPATTIPLSVIKEYDAYRGKRFTMYFAVLALVMIFLMMVPLLFINPKTDLIKLSNNNYKTGMPQYQLTVQSLLPVKTVVAKIDGDKMPIMQEDEDTYIIKPTKDGKMVVTVTSVGKGERHETIVVDSLDQSAPTMKSSAYVNGRLIVYVTDDHSGIDYSKVSALTGEGNRADLLSYNKKRGMLVFEYPHTSINVSIPDKSGNTLQLRLTK